MRYPGSNNLIEQVMRTGTGQLMNSVPAGDFFLDTEEERMSLLCAPLKVEDRTSGVIILTGDQNKSFQAGDLKLLNTIALQTAPAIEIAHLHQKDLENARLERDLQTAFQVQSSMLPNRTPDFKGWQLAAFWQPARIVSGDLYDFIPFAGGKLGLVVADVTDKGVPAALLMANARSVLRGAAANAGRNGVVSPGKLLARVNNVLSEEMPMDMFVTCLLVIVDRRNGTIRYANAGHNPPYLRSAKEVRELRATGLPLGIFPNMVYEEKEAWLEPGDSLLLYSDGLTEAHAQDGDMFGFPRLNSLLSSSGQNQLEGEALIQFLMVQLGDFTGPGWEQEDDITMVAAKRLETDLG
jgi:serine phosphatase RsbU (regulator of sigma subunit)